MPALDIFSGSAFSMVALTDAINKMPFVPGRIGQLGRGDGRIERDQLLGDAQLPRRVEADGAGEPVAVPLQHQRRPVAKPAARDPRRVGGW